MFIEDYGSVGPQYDFRNVCRDAAKYIEDCGWCQHHWRWDTRVCIEGAIGLVARDNVSATAARSELRKALQLPLNKPDALTVWNDADERTEQEIVCVLRQIAFT